MWQRPSTTPTTWASSRRAEKSASKMGQFAVFQTACVSALQWLIPSQCWCCVRCLSRSGSVITIRTWSCMASPFATLVWSWSVIGTSSAEGTSSLSLGKYHCHLRCSLRSGGVFASSCFELQHVSNFNLGHTPVSPPVFFVECRCSSQGSLCQSAACEKLLSRNNRMRRARRLVALIGIVAWWGDACFTR